MVLTRWLLVVVPSSLVLAVAAPHVADACSPRVCTPAAFVPGGYGGTVPANLPGLYWLPQANAHGQTAPDPAQISLARASEPDTQLPFAAMAASDGRAFLLVPDAPFAVGQTYEARDSDECYSHAQYTRFTIGQPAPLPTALGTLDASLQSIGPSGVNISNGACQVSLIAAQSLVRLTLDASAEPWAELLQLETLVDGQPWSEGPQLTRDLRDLHPTGAVVQVFETCDTSTPGADPGLTTGDHVVELRATVAGTTTTVASTSVSVHLQCTPTAPAGDDAGCNATAPARPRGAARLTSERR